MNEKKKKKQHRGGGGGGGGGYHETYENVGGGSGGDFSAHLGRGERSRASPAGAAGQDQRYNDMAPK